MPGVLSNVLVQKVISFKILLLEALMNTLQLIVTYDLKLKRTKFSSSTINTNWNHQIVTIERN